MEKIIGTVPGKCRKKREKARLTLNNNPEISWHMKKSRRTYNGVHLNKKSNTQDVVEQSLTINDTFSDIFCQFRRAIGKLCKSQPIIIYGFLWYILPSKDYGNGKRTFFCYSLYAIWFPFRHEVYNPESFFVQYGVCV